MPTRVALLAGTTGLVGSSLLEMLLASDGYTHVVALSRKPLDITHAKLENIVVDFDKLSDYPLQADDVFCCLGTTMKQAKSKEAFRKVDFDYPLQLAKQTKETGATQYLLVSALGAKSTSAIFYNKVKGEIEETITAVGFTSFHIFRPSLLLGSREEQRSGEDAAKVFYKLFNFLIPKKYKGIEAEKVARAMLVKALDKTPGKFVHESDSLQRV